MVVKSYTIDPVCTLPQHEVQAPTPSNRDNKEPNRLFDCVPIFPLAYDLKKAVGKEQKSDTANDSHSLFPSEVSG
jgi:hypothetical protein